MNDEFKAKLHFVSKELDIDFDTMLYADPNVSCIMFRKGPNEYGVWFEDDDKSKKGEIVNISSVEMSATVVNSFKQMSLTSKEKVTVLLKLIKSLNLDIVELTKYRSFKDLN